MNNINNRNFQLPEIWHQTTAYRNTQGIGPLVGSTSGNRRSVMHILVVI